MLLPRFYKPFLDVLLKQFPVVCVLGPRQCGKTTFIKETLPEWKYFDLERPSDRTVIEGDPEALFQRHPNHVIFDEAQQLTNLFSILRSVVDAERNKKGRFVLLGSSSPHLIQNISETLAGRVGFLDMSPFHVREVSNETELWVRGGFPDAYLIQTPQEHSRWCEAYTRTFIERDLKMYGIDVNPSTMRRLWTMLAHLHGGILNASDLGNALAINYHTVSRYIDILEQTFLVRRLKPYFANIGKRLIKSPKIYLRDTGLLHYFLNIADEDALAHNPKCGHSWEGFVMEQIIVWLSLNKPATEFYFWQTSTRQEVDLLIKKGDNILPIEIKRHTAPTRQDVAGLFACMEDLKLKKGFVVRPNGQTYSLGEGIAVVTLKELMDQI